MYHNTRYKPEVSVLLDASTLLSARIRPCVQRNLAHKKQRPPRTIQKTYA
jgi:hypothetical protein